MTEKMLIDAYLKRLRLPAIAQHYEALARDAAQTNQPYETYLLSLLEHELRQREENRTKARLKQARFPVPKTVESFDFEAIPSLNRHLVLELHRCEFIKRCENVLFIGNSGTGKTHLATSLGITACKMGYNVRFYGAAQLVAELIEANEQRRLNRLEKQWLKWNLVLVDELGYIPFSPTGAQLLFQFLSARYERGSVIITTNLEFAHWTEVFGDERLTTALLDRLTHRAHILPLNGESYRFKESLKRSARAS